MRSVEATGKKIDDAIKEGLAQLGGLTIDDVDVEILCSGGWLKKAKVRLTVCEEEEATADKAAEISVESEVAPEVKRYTAPVVKAEKREPKTEDKPARRERNERRPEKKAEKPVEVKAAEDDSVAAEPQPVKPVSEQQVELAKAYIGELLKKMGVEAELTVDTSCGAVDVDIVTEDSSVIGHHGEVLDAIQILAKRAVEEGEDKHLAVHVDCKGYRAQRERTLVAMANRMAAKAIKTGRKVVLEPMSNTQRKIIHATLNDNSKVFTKSEGHEPNRRVVIIPKRNRRRRSSGSGNAPAAATESNE